MPLGFLTQPEEWGVLHHRDYHHVSGGFWVLGFPGGSDDKESASNAGDLGLIPGLGKSPGEGHGNPLQYLCLENPHGQRSLAGYSPWGLKKSDMTERLTLCVLQGLHMLDLQNLCDSQVKTLDSSCLKLKEA